ncbi:hypothetical protein FRC15_000843 [Serendipita sp. 397]|nr:hypothetical protein FRC15_000843 [Serendipita sp. 397]
MSDPPSSDAMVDVLPTNQQSGETVATGTAAPTTLKIFCLLFGEGVAFSVTIGSDETVDELKEAIHKKTPNLSSIDPKFLKLYLINIVDEEDEDSLRDTVENLSLGKHLGPATRPLYKVFSGPLADETIHILVKLPELEGPPLKKRKRGPSSSSLNVASEREEYFQSAPMRAPSNRATPKNFAEMQSNSKAWIFCGRPNATEPPIPIALLHDAFGAFVDETKTYTPTADDYNFTQDCRLLMSAFYPNESARAEAFRDLMEKTDIKLDMQFIGTFHTDGSASVGKNFFMITEAKDEAAGNAAEPFFQSISYYLESVRAKPPVVKSVFPCFLVYYFGAGIGVAGAVLTGRVNAEMFDQLARTLGALRLAYSRLQNYYESNVFNHDQLAYPYPTDYKLLRNDGTESEETISFCYDRKYEEKLLFFAITKDSQPQLICIKFSRSYSKEAHLCAAKIGLAPKLLGFRTLPGGWFMAVMEDLTPMGISKHPEISQAEADEFQQKVQEYHSHGFVHGDIRIANAFVVSSSNIDGGTKSDQHRVKLVDFDWSGRSGEVYYPSLLNREIYRPDGVQDGALISEEHDNAAVQVVIEQLLA